ncbi:MAG: lysophospholipid acyltransferase family protein [Stenotrophobium sp.]
MTVRIVGALLWLLHWLPLSVIALMGDVLGSLIYFVARERRRVGAMNLRLCFPDMDETERRRILRANFRMMARFLLEYGYCWYASADQLRRLVRIEGMEHLRALDGKPVILFAGHFVGLEIAGMRLATEVPIVDIFTRQKHRGIDALISAKRVRFGGRVISRQDGLRPVLRALKEGLRLYYLPDQDLGERDSVFVPFFGVPTATITGLPRMARAARAAIVPCFVHREPNGYVLRIEAPLADFPLENLEAAARRMNAELESRILATPEQYFWLHKRFKTRPAGQARFYK